MVTVKVVSDGSSVRERERERECVWGLLSMKKDERGMNEDRRDFITDRGTGNATSAALRRRNPAKGGDKPNWFKSVNSIVQCLFGPANQSAANRLRCGGWRCPKFGAGPSKRYQIL